MPVKETINRDVGEQSKGPRLQRLRAVNLLLDALNRPDFCLAYCAVEFEGDVYYREATATESGEYHEENKNYDMTTNFTLASAQVLNTLIIYLDCWIGKACSPNVLFGFYAPNGCGKERSTARTNALQIEWPSKPMLEILQNGQTTDPSIISIVRILIIDEYKLQYNYNSSANGQAGSEDDTIKPGNLAVIDEWSDEEWQGFLNQISWKLGQEDATQLEETLKQKVRHSPLYNQSISGKEGHVIELMCGMLDKRQAIADPVMRFVHISDVNNVFLMISTQTYRLPDPSYKTWERLPKPEDTRNLTDKVLAVSNSVPKEDLGRWNRKASNSMIVQEEYSDDPSIKAFKYQLYDACSDKLAELRRENAGQPLTSEQITHWVSVLLACCDQRIEDCSKHYAYSISGQAFLTDMIWELFDSCYLAFDAGAA